MCEKQFDAESLVSNTINRIYNCPKCKTTHTVKIAKNLALPTILVSSAHGKDLKDAVANIELSINSFAEKDVEVQAVFINRNQGIG